MGRGHHLHDDSLYESYLADREGEPLDPPVADHLSDCPACGARYAELTGFLNAVRAEAAQESDTHFTPERLGAQREQVARLIERASHSAHVIGFPGRATQRVARASTRVAPRWLAAAAAAGLFVGVSVGGVFRDFGGARSSAAANVASVQPAGARLSAEPAVVISPAPAVTEAIDDDRFLIELELALEHPSTRELQPFDALMPRAREISSQVR